MAALQFELQYTDQLSKARAGNITTDHGEILTPIFMPVGTAGSVKAVTSNNCIMTYMHRSFLEILIICISGPDWKHWNQQAACISL